MSDFKSDDSSSSRSSSNSSDDDDNDDDNDNARKTKKTDDEPTFMFELMDYNRYLPNAYVAHKSITVRELMRLQQKASQASPSDKNVFEEMVESDGEKGDVHDADGVDEKLVKRRVRRRVRRKHKHSIAMRHGNEEFAEFNELHLLMHSKRFCNDEEVCEVVFF